MLSSRLVFPSSIFSMIRFSSSILVSYVPVMIHTLHDHRAAPVMEPEPQPVAFRDLRRPSDNPSVFFGNAVPAGKNGQGAPAFKGCPEFCEDEPLPLEPGGKRPVEPVRKIHGGGLPFVQAPEEPLGTEAIA